MSEVEKKKEEEGENEDGEPLTKRRKTEFSLSVSGRQFKRKTEKLPIQSISFIFLCSGNLHEEIREHRNTSARGFVYSGMNRKKLHIMIVDQQLIIIIQANTNQFVFRGAEVYIDMDSKVISERPKT